MIMGGYKPLHPSISSTDSAGERGGWEHSPSDEGYIEVIIKTNLLGPPRGDGNLPRW